jgi:WD40 repeat protein
LASPNPTPLELRGHEGDIFAVAISPDGRYVLTGSGDGTARLWDVMPNTPTSVTLPGHGGSVAMSPDGRWAVTAGGETRLWDLRSKAPESSSVVLRARHEEEWSLVWALAFSSDSRWLATGSTDHLARVWDLKTNPPGSSAYVLSGHTSAVESLAISPNGRWLATGSQDNTARLWNLEAEDPSASSIELLGHEDHIFTMSITSDSRWLATAGHEPGAARLWDLTADDPSRASVVLRGHTNRIRTIVSSPDGRWIITACDDRTVRLWDLNIDALMDRARQLAGRELRPAERRQYLLDDV